MYIFSPRFLQEGNASHYPRLHVHHTAISLQKQGEELTDDLIPTFQVSQSHEDDSSVSCDIGTHWTAQTGKLTDCWLRHPRTSLGKRKEVLSGKPYYWHSNLANRGPRLFHSGFFLPNSISPPSYNYIFGAFFISILVYIEFSFFKQIIQITVLCD